MERYKFEHRPNIIEAYKAREEARIVLQQPINLLLEDSIKWVADDLQREVKTDFFFMCCMFNYGYILGKRAERAKRKKTNSST